MPFQLTLYRAPEDVGPLDTWDCEHRQPLGTKVQVRRMLDEALSGLCWNEKAVLWSAVGPFGGEDHAVEVSLHGEEGDLLHDFRIYALPPVVRVVMTALELNYCYAMDSCKMYYPFLAGTRWPADAR